MSLRVTFLGTGGAIPTPRRSLPSVLVERKGESLLFDCGENAQRQMIIAKKSFHKKMKIFVTHLHGDHVLGLPGLLQTMTMLDRTRELEIYGPPGILGFLEGLRTTVQFALTFSVGISEISGNGVVCQGDEYIIKAMPANHVIPALCYGLFEKPRPGRFDAKKAVSLGVPEGQLWGKLQNGHQVKSLNGKIVKPSQVLGPKRPGRRLVYTGDTRPIKGLSTFARSADVIIHDSTLDDELAERAEQDGHSTPSQAATQAKKAKASQLILTHFSARYDDTEKLIKQARKIFRNTIAAEDFMQIEIPLKTD